MTTDTEITARITFSELCSPTGRMTVASMNALLNSQQIPTGRGYFKTSVEVCTPAGRISVPIDLEPGGYYDVANSARARLAGSRHVATLTPSLDTPTRRARIDVMTRIVAELDGL